MGNFKRGLIKIGMTVAKNSPTILTAVGGVTLAGAVGSAIFCTYKSAGDIVEEHKTKVAEVKKAAEIAANDPSVTFTKQDEVANYIRIYAKDTVGVLKAYWPTITLTAISLASFLSGHHILRKRYTGVVAAFGVVSEAFNSYRERVRDIYGEKADIELLTGGKMEKVDVIDVDPESGKEKKTKEELLVHPETEFGNSFYSVTVGDLKNINWWSKDIFSNLRWLNGTIAVCNMDLHSKGYLFLIDVYKKLDVIDLLTPEQLQAAHVVGWLDNGDGDCTVDFGVYTGMNEEALRVKPYHAAEDLVLDFNVDGVIWDKVGY